MCAQSIHASAFNAENKFRSVTVRHIASGESFAHQTFTSSDSEALRFARQTFSEKIYECSKLEDRNGDGGASAVERERALVYSER